VCPVGVILERVLAQWRRLVAFMKAMNLLHQAMHRRIVMAIKTVSKVGVFFIFALFAVALAATRVIRSK